MKVCFAGDVFLGGDLLQKDCASVVDSQAYHNADLRVINLEQPVSDNDYVADKCTLYTGSYAVRQLKQLKVNAVSLANNHIQDKGISAIGETIEHLDSVSIGHFGAGVNLESAGKAYWLTSDIAVLGYCEFGKPYLNQIALADLESPGVNPLRIQKIKEDLAKLPSGKKAILHFHWGMEHVWLPPVNDIALVKQLLEDERVITIIGMHAHRVQGVINHAGKQAYMCLGNFIFPNFYISSPVQIYYPPQTKKVNARFTTRQYHSVYELTYKKWRWVNRVSLMLEFCTESKKIKPVFMVQDDDVPQVHELKDVGLYFYRIWFNLLSKIYKLPKPIYQVLWRGHAFEVKTLWRLQIHWFHLKQLGLNMFMRKVFSYGRKKIGG